MLSMPWILDAILVVILLIFVGIGVHRGAIRTVVEFFGSFVALIVAAMVSNTVTEPLFTETIRPMVLNAMENMLEDAIAGSADPMANLMEKIPDFAVRYFENGALAQKIEGALMLGATDGAQMLTDGVIGPVVQLLLRGVIAVLTFLVVSVLLRVIAEALDLVAKLPVLHQLNEGLGAVCGAAKGLVVVVLLVTLVTAVVPFVPENDFITMGHIEESMIFQQVNKINPLKNWVNWI
jgi:uncharacterized membrane protein required for colicin V production